LALDEPPKQEATKAPAFSLALVDAPAVVDARVETNGSIAARNAEPLPAGDEVVCPKCELRQLKRTLCRRCGIDMPRFLEAETQAAAEAAAEKLRPYEASRSMSIHELIGERARANVTPALFSLSY
jgi:hypothetical protein